MLAVKIKAKGYRPLGSQVLVGSLALGISRQHQLQRCPAPNVNNNYTMSHASLGRLMEEEPEDFGDFFETRQLRGGEPKPK